MSERVRTPARPSSLVARVAWLTAAWALPAALVTALVLVAIYRASVERDFDAILAANLNTLVAGTSVSPEGTLDVATSLGLGDARFEQLGSGWYWRVEPVGFEADARAAYPGFEVESGPLPPFDEQYRRNYPATGTGGVRMLGVETEVVLDAEGRTGRFLVFGARSDVEGRVRDFALALSPVLALFAIGSVLAAFGSARFGLRPLDRLRASLQDVREGRAERLDPDVPVEVAPLVEETNALIAGNRRVVERARTAVGNLAHGLKTPLAVVTNEARGVGGEAGRVLGEQAGRMRAQIEAYLDRARIAAGSRAFSDTDAGATIATLVAAIAKIAPDRRIEFGAFDPAQDGGPARGERLRFEGERHDLEEVAGNLIENAAKWARRLVLVTLRGEGARLALVVEDDGPGLSEEAARDALKRGVRLDETTEGSGLGLSIVRDIVREYGGELALDRSDLGGLRVTVLLPRRGGEAGSAPAS